MKKLLIVLLFIPLVIASCSGDKTSETNENSEATELEQISADAQKTAKELEQETDKLENSVDSLLTDI